MAQYSPNIEFIIVNTSVKPNEKFYLDIEKVTDFPLALTYSIKDVQDPSSSKGSYSKTFSIPATGRNNTTLKNLYSESLYDSHQYVEDYDALIFVDGMNILEGKFQIKGTKYQGIPKSYECQVFGENFKWVNALADLNLCDIDFSAGNFFPLAPVVGLFSRDAIKETWNFGEAGDIQGGVQTHIVYPLINTGKWNFEDATTGEGIPTPSDFSPAFYFYNMLKCIFAAQGYTLQSTFFETSWFKRLVSFIPMESFVNNAAIVESYSFDYSTSDTTPWKTPLNYYHQDGATLDCYGTIGTNAWHGQSYGLTITCPTCDPAGQITIEDITPFFNTTTPYDISGLHTLDDPFHFAGWYWANYGTGLTNGGAQSDNVPWPYSDNPCILAGGTTISQNMPWRTWGHDYFCADCEPWYYNPAIGLPYPYPYLGSKEIVMTDTSMFATTYLGIYEFSGGMYLEMNNDYEINNPVAQYDPWPPYTSSEMPPMQGTGNGGSNFAAHSNLYGYDTYTGTAYDFNVYLIHYKHATRSCHVVHAVGKRVTNSLNTMGGLSPSTGAYNNLELFNDQFPLSAHTTNLKKNLNFTGIQIDIIDVEDRVFLYSEVNCIMGKTNSASTGTGVAGGIGAQGTCQMKYRARSQSFSGTIDPVIIAGGSVDLELLLPCDQTQLEWVNGLTGLFNLFWQSNEQTKTIIVEPRDSFFKHYTESVNWTEKLHHGSNQENSYIYDALKRNLCFTYENDSADGLVEERNRRRGQICELGSHAINLGDLYLNEEQKIGSDYYAPTYMFYDKSVSNNQGADKQPFIPIIHSEYSSAWNVQYNVNLPDKLTEFATRILTWYGLQPLNQVDGITSANTWRFGFDDLTDPTENLQTYPFAGVYSDQVGNLGGTLLLGGVTYNSPSLYFEQSEINVVATPPPYDLTNGLYQMFWESHILSLINRPVVKKAFFKLTPYDIANLDYRKLIYIEGAQADTYWVMNKITDFKAGANQLTIVELFEYSNTRGVSKVSMKKGFGANLTPQWTDFNAQPIAFGVAKVASEYMTSSLDIANERFINNPTNQILRTQKLPSQVGIAQPININYTSDGTRVPTQLAPNAGGNIGNNQNIGVGAISIGKNINQTSSNIVIGDGNNQYSTQPIQFTQNGITALAISNGGLMLEGGGGCVYYENPAGEIMEVMTGIPYHTIQVGITPKFNYVRCLLSEPSITQK